MTYPMPWDVIKQLKDELAAIIGVPSASALVIKNNASTPNTNIDISAAFLCMVDEHLKPLPVQAFSATINTTTTGLNGLDTGSREADSWYYFFAITDGETHGAIASLSATAPTMPDGFTHKVRVGANRTDASGNFYRVEQFGSRARYVLDSATNTYPYPTIASGVVGTLGPTNFATPEEFDLSDVIPATSVGYRVVLHCYSSTSGVAGVSPNVSSTGLIPLPGHNTYGGDLSAQQWAGELPGEFMTDSRKLYFYSSQANKILFLTGWVDAVSAT